MRSIIGALLFFAGLLLIVGAAGGFEQNLCSVEDMYKIMAGGFGMVIISYFVFGDQ